MVSVMIPASAQPRSSHSWSHQSWVPEVPGARTLLQLWHGSSMPSTRADTKESNTRNRCAAVGCLHVVISQQHTQAMLSTDPQKQTCMLAQVYIGLPTY